MVETERSAVRRALNEERSRYCAFVSCIKPMLDEEAHMVSEFQQLEEVSRVQIGYVVDGLVQKKNLVAGFTTWHVIICSAVQYLIGILHY